jgi:hypothetical protein
LDDILMFLKPKTFKSKTCSQNLFEILRNKQ